jgi:hypothetical protein
MSGSRFGARLTRLFTVRGRASAVAPRRSKARRVPAVESLERRSLLANITASGVISSTPVGQTYDYSIMLSNSGSSSASIGTFWFAWTAVPYEDFLATRPISVAAPTGWTDSITHSGASDGYGILFSANGSADYVSPGSSLVFQFTSADTPASVNGDSNPYPGTPATTSVVYPQFAYSDAGHQFVVTPGSVSSMPPPLVTLRQVEPVFNKQHLVSEIQVSFSGAVDTSDAQETGIYRLVTPGKNGSFAAKNAGSIKLRSALYNGATDTIKITPRKPFALSKAVELVINATAPSGLQDTSGRLIDGADNGTPGSDAVAVLRRSGVVIDAIALARSI